MTFCKGSFKNEGVHVGWDKSYLEFLVGLGSATHKLVMQSWEFQHSC